MKCAVIIVEGVNKDLLEKEIQKGALPWWGEAVKKHPLLDMDCGPVPYEPSNLATAFTGVNPGNHGCYSYWATEINGAPPRVLTSADVKQPFCWTWPELEDQRFVVANVQLTFPPEPVNGKLISYLMNHSLNYTYPKDVKFELQKKGLRYAHDVSAFYKGEPLDVFAKEIKRVAKFQFDAIHTLAQDCDILVANLTIADRLSHFLWSEIESYDRHNSVPHILESYKFLDVCLAKLSDLLDPDGSMIIFTEIGFGPIKSFTSINQYLRDGGLLKGNGNGAHDFSKSMACESVQGTHGINILDTGSAYHSRIEEVGQFLKELTFDDGVPVVSKVTHREELYHGPWSHLAPDLIITPGDLSRPPLGDEYWANHVNRHYQTGWHRNEGFCQVIGKPLAITSETTVPMTAITPTIAKAVGRDWPATCESAPIIR